MPDSVTIDTSSFRKFARDLKRAEPALAIKLRTNLKAVGELVAVDARSRAGFSSRIPQNIKVGVAGGHIRVYVKKLAPPHKGEERAFEHRGRSGPFRHRVYGKDVWVTQEARPFLKPALVAKQALAVVAARKAVDDALREVRSHV